MPAYLTEHMFENLSERLAGTLLMGLDVAVEFATLGEFRVVDPEFTLESASEPTSTPVPLVRRPREGALLELDRNLLPAPATALARAAAPAPVTQPAPRCQQRRRTAVHAAEPAKRPVSRQRAGSVPRPAQQLCLLTD